MSVLLNSNFEALTKVYTYFLIALILISDVGLGQQTSSSQELLDLNNDVLRSIYYENIAKENQLILSGINKPASDVRLIRSKIKDSLRQNAQAIEVTSFADLFKRDTNLTLANDIVELFFPSSIYGVPESLETITKSGELKSENFQLECLNLTGNGLTEQFLDIYGPSQHKLNSLVYSTQYHLLVIEYFSNLRLVKFSSNKFRHLEQKHFDLFNRDTSELEALFFDSNQISSIRHNTFYGLHKLKYLDLSNNRLKMIHPLTFSVPDSQLNLLNLANNNLRTIFYTPAYRDYNVSNSSNATYSETSEMPLASLNYLFLKGNNDFTCDCGILWLYHFQKTVNYDNFTCNFIYKGNKSDESADDSLYVSEVVPFNTIKDEIFLKKICQPPNMYVNTDTLVQTSSYTLFRSFSNRWFDWTLLVDKLPVTTPYPYLMSDKKMEEINSGLAEFNKYIDYLNRDDTGRIGTTLKNQEKHVFHTWRTSDVVFDCTNKDPNNIDESNSTIIWKTQHGYFSYLDEDLTSTLNSFLNEELGIEDDLNTTHRPEFHNSFKIFYQMNRLTRVYRNLTVKVGEKLGGQSFSNYLVNSNNQLIVTNMRQTVAGPFVCISVNEQGVKTYEYDIHIRVGVDEYFIYCLCVAILSAILPSVVSLVICCVCEYKAARDYQINRQYTCNPTPAGQTPPNFDFNDWVANAASYLPNLKIHETLEGVSKKLRKGMGKASIAVKTLGITSSAYIYSVYEHSTQKWSDIKGYVPTLNVPSLTMPTMKYPPLGQITNRMRTGMGNMFIQVREFCGTSDLNNTASMGDLDFDKASNAVGNQNFILDKLGKTSSNQSDQQNQFQNYYRFLNFLREESRKVNRKKRVTQTSITEIDENEELDCATTTQKATSSGQHDQPLTSAQAMMEEYVDEPTVVALPKLNMIITFSNLNDDIERIEPMNDARYDEETDEDDEYNQYVKKSTEFVNRSAIRKVSESSCQKDTIPFIDNDEQNK